MSTDLREKVSEILQKDELPDRHSFFQIEKFIIGKEPTGQAQLWAIHRELRARQETLDQLDKDLLDAEDNLELFDVRIERVNRGIRRTASDVVDPDSDLNIHEAEINIRKLQREKESLRKAAGKLAKRREYVLQEVRFLAEGYEAVTRKVGPMRPMDDEQAQREMWGEKLLEEFNLRVILKQSLDPEFVKTVLRLHDEAPVKKHVVSLINNIQQQMLAERKATTARPTAEAKPRITGG